MLLVNKKLALLGTASLLVFSNAHAASTTAEERLSKLEDKVSEMEIQNALTKYKLSGAFIGRYEDLNMKVKNEDSGETEKRRVNAFSMYYGLNVDFDVTKNLKFYSTFGMSKFFNNEGRDESEGNYTPPYTSEAGSRGLSGSGVKIDKAFLSYEFEETPVILAFGRMPTNSGPNSNQLDGLDRQGTYPRFMFNAIFDGAAGVFKLDKWLPQNNGFVVRSFYQPFTTLSQKSRTKYYSDDAGTATLTKTTSHQGVALVEYHLKNQALFGQLDVMYMYAQWKNFFNGVYEGTFSKEDGKQHGFYLGLEDIGHFGLNISANAMSFSRKVIGSNEKEIPRWGYLFSINQKFSFLGNTILGYEYLKTGDQWYLDDWTTLDLAKFYRSANSIGHHAYLSVPLSNKVTTRMGYYYIDKKRVNWADGAEPPLLSHSVYAQIRISM